MDYKIGRILISQEELHSRIKEIGSEIRKRYTGKQLICVCVLKGAVVFLADLIREIGPEVDVQIDFLAISSYGASTKSSGVVKIQKDLSSDIHGKHVLIVEDILDTGLSLTYIKRLLSERNPESVEIAVLLDKAERRQQPDDVGQCRGRCDGWHFDRQRVRSGRCRAERSERRFHIQRIVERRRDIADCERRERECVERLRVERSVDHQRHVGNDRRHRERADDRQRHRHDRHGAARRRHLLRLQPRHVRDRKLRCDHQPAAGRDPCRGRG